MKENEKKERKQEKISMNNLKYFIICQMNHVSFI